MGHWGRYVKFKGCLIDMKAFGKEYYKYIIFKRYRGNNLRRMGRHDTKSQRIKNLLVSKVSFHDSLLVRVRRGLWSFGL